MFCRNVEFANTDSRFLKAEEVPKVGFEPTRAQAHTALNRARLPVSPLRRFCSGKCNNIIKKSQVLCFALDF